MSSKLVRMCFRASNLSRRTFSGTPAPGHHKVKTVQKKFTQDDGLPVHFKAGSKDKLLYNGTRLTIILLDLWGCKVVIWDASIVPWLATF